MMAEPRRSGGDVADDRDSSDLMGARILIAEARFYEAIADALLQGATRALQNAGAVLERLSVPGSRDAAPAIARALDAAERAGKPYEGAVEALSQMDIAATGLNDIAAEFESHWIGGEVEGAQYLPAEAAFFRDVVSGVVREQRSLDPLIDKVLAGGWPLKRIEAILRAVLRAGAHELGHRSAVPARVVVSEYVDVANAFVDRDETGMVNAVLDQIARGFLTPNLTASR